MDPAITCTELSLKLSNADPALRPLVIDVRRPPAFVAASDFIGGALRRDPGAVTAWAAALPPKRDVVVYCVHGHEVSQGVARALREAGVESRFLEHGIEGWRAAGYFPSRSGHRPPGSPAPARRSIVSHADWLSPTSAAARGIVPCGAAVRVHSR